MSDMKEQEAENTKEVIAERSKPRFKNVSCSNCGKDFGPGDHGFSHCESHKGKRYES